MSEEYGLLLGELKRIAKEKGNDTSIKVGMENGYIYVGTVGDLISNIKKYEGMLKQWHKNRIEKAEDTLKNAKKKQNLCSPQGFAQSKSDINGYEDLTWKEYQKYVEEYFEGIRRAYREIRRREKVYASLTPLSNRQVERICDSIYESDVICMIVGGTEKGKYWALDEAETLPAFALEVKEVEEGASD